MGLVPQVGSGYRKTRSEPDPLPFLTPVLSFWRKRWLIWRVAASIFFSALVDLVASGIRVSFLDFTDDSIVSCPFLCFFVYVIQNTFIFPTVVAWLVFATLWVCNDATLCYFLFSFYYCYNMMLIFRTFSLHTHESTLQLFLWHNHLEELKKKKRKT